MRNRIPVSRSDVEVNGRPGPVSRLAFQIKSIHLPQIKLGTAQKLLCHALGYSNLNELRHEAFSAGSDIPNPGEITMDEVEKVMVHSLTHKSGMAHDAAQQMIRKLDLKLLSVYKLTAEGMNQSGASSNSDPRPVVLLDEMHRAWQNPYNSPHTDPLIDAGAPAYSFAVREDGQAVLFTDLIKACEDLKQRDDGDDSAERLALFYRNELIPSCYKPVTSFLTSTGEPLLPDGCSVTYLYTRKGAYVGRCLRADWAHGLYPSIRLGMGIYEDVQSLLLGRRIAGRIEEPSHDGAFAGSNGWYEGDQQLYTLRLGTVPAWMKEAADEGRAEDLQMPVDDLRPLHNVCLADGRLRGHGGVFVKAGGGISEISEAHLVMCGDKFQHQGQAFVRDQDWIKPADIPAFILDADGVQQAVAPGVVSRSRAQPIIPMATGLVHEPLLGLAEQARKALLRSEAEASQIYRSAEVCLSVIAAATDICPRADLSRALSDELEAALPVVLSDYYEYDSAEEYAGLRKLALETLEGIGSKMAHAFPDITWLKPAVIGMLICLPMYRPHIEVISEWTETCNGTPIEEQLGLLACRMLLVSCLISSKKPNVASMAFDLTAQHVVARAVLDGSIQPSEALDALERVHQMKRKTTASIQLGASLRFNVARQMSKQRAASEAGFTAVGFDLKDAGKKQELPQAQMRLNRKFSSATTPAV